MKETFEIKRSMFGGYNKKQTLAYISELQKMVEETQTAMGAMEKENGGLKQKLEEARETYSALWNHSKELERSVKTQEEDIQIAMEEVEAMGRENEELAQNLEEVTESYAALQENSKELKRTVKAQGETISQQKKELVSIKRQGAEQEYKLKRMMKKLAVDFTEDIQKIIEKQLKRLYKKQKEKTVDGKGL